MPTTAPNVETWLEQGPRGGQASWFRDILGQCSDAMLQYEWAWMHERLSALTQCRLDANGGAPATGPSRCPPEARLTALLMESQLFQTLLLQEFTSRGLQPLPPLGPVVASEEAWEITSASVREAWGIQP